MKTTFAPAALTHVATGGTGLFTRGPHLEQDLDKGGAAADPAPVEPPITMSATELRSLIGDTVAKALEARETSGAGKPTKHIQHMGPQAEPAELPEEPERVVVGKDLAAGMSFVRVVKALATAALDGHHDPVRTLEAWGKSHGAAYARVAKAMRDDRARMDQMRALGQSVLVDGGALVPTQFSTEFIELLRHVTVVRKSGARSIPLSGTLSMAKQTGAGTASYVGENLPATPSQQTFGMVTWSEKKLIALTAISNQLIRNAAISAEEFIRNDLLQVMSLKEDITFLLSDGSQNTPKGLLYLLDPSMVLPAVGTATDVQNPTLKETKILTNNMMRLLDAADIPVVNRGWVMSPRTKFYLSTVDNGLGVFPYDAELEAGRFRGLPYVLTNQFAENLNFHAGDSNEVDAADGGYLALVEWSNVVIAEGQQVAVEAFPNAAYEEGGVVKSGVSRDQSVIRTIATHDLNLRHTKTGVIQKVRMGA